MILIDIVELPSVYILSNCCLDNFVDFIKPLYEKLASIWIAATTFIFLLIAYSFNSPTVTSNVETIMKSCTQKPSSEID